MMAATLCDNLRLLMFRENVKAIDLSKRTKIPPATIHRMLSGESKNPHFNSLDPIANFFSITVDQLMGESTISLANMIFKSEGQNYAPLFPLHELAKEERDAQQFTSFCTSDANVNQHCIATTLKDEAMIPLFPPGTVIIIDPNKPIVNGCYAIIKTNKNDVIFRQVIYNDTDCFLKALNPDITTFSIKRYDEEYTTCGILVQAKLNF